MGAKTNKKIETNNLVIDNNVFRFDDNAIQIRNISQVRIDQPPGISYIAGIIISLLGIVFLNFNKEWGGVTIAIGIITMLIILYLNNNADTFLIVELTSGQILSFSCNKEEFLIKILDEFVYCMNNSSYKNINLQNCTISSSHIGDNHLSSLQYGGIYEHDKFE